MANVEKLDGATALEKSLGASRAVRVGQHVFVSGQMALDEAGTVVHEGALGAQFKRALETLVEVVEAAGGTRDDVVATHMFLTRYPNEDDFGQICDAHRNTFSGTNRPTGTMVYVPRLPVEGALVEITGVAVIGEPSKA